MLEVKNEHSVRIVDVELFNLTHQNPASQLKVNIACGMPNLSFLEFAGNLFGHPMNVCAIKIRNEDDRDIRIFI